MNGEKYGQTITKNNDVIINFRQHPFEYKNTNKDIDEILANIIKKVSDDFEKVT